MISINLSASGAHFQDHFGIISADHLKTKRNALRQPLHVKVPLGECQAEPRYRASLLTTIILGTLSSLNARPTTARRANIPTARSPVQWLLGTDKLHTWKASFRNGSGWFLQGGQVAQNECHHIEPALQAAGRRGRICQPPRPSLTIGKGQETPS